MVKHLYGASFVSKLFLSVVSYIIVLFVYLSSPIWHHLLLIFHTSLSWYLAFRERLSVKCILCRLDACNLSIQRITLSVVGTTLSVVHFTLSVVSVGWTHYSVGWAQCITERSVVNIYSVGCTHYKRGCRLCTMLGQLQTYTLSVVHTTRITHLFWESP